MTKVHPIHKKRNISTQNEVASTNRQKKLRRLPHIFAKVLELPFPSAADVSVTETPISFRFVAPAYSEFGSDVRARMVEICPGVVKIVVDGDVDLLNMDVNELELEVDFWRFRLPDCTRPDMATAVCVGGELIVVVPKGDEAVTGDGDWRRDRLVIV